MATPATRRHWLARSPGFWHALACIGLVVLTAGTFANALRNEFVDFDDWGIIETNPLIRSLSLANIWHVVSTDYDQTWLPLRVLSYAVDYHLWGLNAFGYHLTNLVLHTANVLLVYALLAWLLRRPLPACLGAALFAIHPVQVPAVTWACGRRDVLYAFFFLVSYLCFLAQERTGGRRRRRFLYGASVACVALSLLSKASGMMLPAILLLTIVLFDREGQSLKRRLLLCVPHAAITGVLVAVHFFLARQAGVVQSRGLLERLPSVPWIFGMYVRLMFFPISLLTPHARSLLSWPAEARLVVTCAAVVVGAIAMACWALPRPRVLLFCFGWWFLMLLPFSGLVEISMLVAERYLYLPMVGACALAGAVLADLAATKRRAIVVGVCTVAILGLLATATRCRNRVWENPRTFWWDGVSKLPAQPVARAGLGAVYLERDEPLRGWRHYMAFVLQDGEAYSDLKDHVELAEWGMRSTYSRIARRWEAAGRRGDALAVCELARDQMRDRLDVRVELAKAYLRRDMGREARAEISEARKLYEKALEEGREVKPRLRIWLERQLGVKLKVPEEEPAQ